MKSLQEIKEEYAKELDNGSFESWDHFRNYNDIEEEDLEIIAKRYATEYAKEVQRLCAEKTVKEYVRPRTLNYAEISDLILSEDNLLSHE